MKECIFCEIIDGKRDAHVVFRDKDSIGFLDKRPLFPGHLLLVPREHVETLMEADDPTLTRLMLNARRLAKAVRKATDCEGIFVANNNIVSQSVPHLHVHIVPRKKGDGLKGFFWPRNPYGSEKEMDEIAGKIRAAL